MDLVTKINLEAARCVACGLCLPHCPTYRETRTENESPRGRIALMRALARNELPLTARLESHLSLCLTCRNCEDVCPADVRYGNLIDSARALIEARRPRSFTQRVLRKATMDGLIARPANLRVLGNALRLYQKSGLQRVLRSTRLLRLLRLERWENQLPQIPPQPKWQQRYSAQSTYRGKVGLFTGCATAIFDRETLTAAIQVLTRLGYDVHVPHGQVCCGALHLHAGEPEKAAALIRRNIDAFCPEQIDAVISTASGCGATLVEYADYLPNDPRARAFSTKFSDINRFLSDIDWPADIRLASLNTHIAIHDPCTLRNVLHDETQPYRLLEKIPGTKVSELPENNLCCGAAGVYFLTQANMAESLRTTKLKELVHLKPDILATSNIGCALYLSHGIREAGLNIDVVHPIVLIDRQLQVASGE